MVKDFGDSGWKITVLDGVGRFAWVWWFAMTWLLRRRDRHGHGFANRIWSWVAIRFWPWIVLAIVWLSLGVGVGVVAFGSETLADQWWWWV